MKSFSIYYLLDPNNGAFRYVGYSSDPKKRYVDHILQSSNCLTHKECWIAGLCQQGLVPTLAIKCILQGADEAKCVEMLLIAALRNKGANLVNGTKGGDGSAGFKWSAENYRKHEEYWNAVGRQKLSPLKGRAQTQQHIEATRAANTLQLLIRRGASIKAAWARRKGMPTAKRGKPSGRQPSLGLRWQMTDEQRQHIRNAWTPERRIAQAERMRDVRKQGKFRLGISGTS